MASDDEVPTTPGAGVSTTYLLIVKGEGSSAEIFVISVILCIASFGYAGSANIHNVLDYGAVGNGISDDTQALLKAWARACGGGGGPNPSIIIPAGKTFLLKPVAFNGPCKSKSILFQVLGNLIAPNTIAGWGGASNWLTFHGVNGLKIGGSGRIGGQGAVWWAQSCKIHPEKKCTLAPTALLLDACNYLHVSGITLFNNPRNHISINSCNNVYISSVTITAPADSPNTDGIDIEHSQYVNIWQSTIGTGDDCIAIGNGGKNVNISWVTCGPGHGISIGSLGQDDEFAEVENVQVMHCTFTGTLNGARIKTWQGGSGYARGILFDDMHINNVENPIIIDQYYCNGDHNCNNRVRMLPLFSFLFFVLMILELENKTLFQNEIYSSILMYSPYSSPFICHQKKRLQRGPKFQK
ncbi:probable polygalacturonase At3g15720 [Magnolia sinica]|uniref:probable polygalacturonase At3g15720 n=1 Tax=Magnolia sinica TaxID=86752 RepID=UPI0026581B39|nr:probable polygalacturonase At3g15720 [Magnolia sinica]